MMGSTMSVLFCFFFVLYLGDRSFAAPNDKRMDGDYLKYEKEPYVMVRHPNSIRDTGSIDQKGGMYHGGLEGHRHGMKKPIGLDAKQTKRGESSNGRASDDYERELRLLQYLRRILHEENNS